MAGGGEGRTEEGGAAFVGPDNVALLVDYYELAMLDAALAEGLTEEAAFSLFVRRLPPSRNFLLACGIDDTLDVLESLRFTPEAVDWLASLGRFSGRLLEYLRGFRFEGEVFAVGEGTPVFGQEPLLEVVAPYPQAQLVETLLINQVHLQTVSASKCARVVSAAAGRRVVEFGLRRIHGTDAGLKVARAFFVAGGHATSNVLAGRMYGVPITGTMAHSYVQAHESEVAAFRAFLRAFPGATMLVDTYDTMGAIPCVIELAREAGEGGPGSVRLDSGDLGALAREVRRRLDEAGLERIRIVASGGLDEDEIARLVSEAAPIDVFGVGTAMGVSADAPALDMAYKLVSYAGRPRLKLSSGKHLLPGRKQIFRVEEGGRAIRDVLARVDETLAGRPLLEQVMHGGRRLRREPLGEARARAARELAALPAEIRGIGAATPYPVEVSPALERLRAEVEAGIRAGLEVAGA